jgi:RNA polymerase sigma-70 factor (ECF subfamily)
VANAGAEFEQFATNDGQRLRRVLVARFGVDAGNDVTDEAMAYAWEHWDRVRSLANPVGYLYRVAQSAARRHARWRRAPRFPPETSAPAGIGEPGLPAALAALKPVPRTCVVLVHVYDWTYEETAAVLGISTGAVRNHLHRGLRVLRSELGDER